MKILSKEEVYKAKYFRINKIVLEKNDKTFTKEFIEKNATVFILPVYADGNLHMITQHRDAFNTTLLEVVAGTMEEHGEPLATAQRELKEETGLTATNWKQIAEWELSVNMNSKIYVFVATGLTEGVSSPEEDEDITQVKMSLDEAVQNVISGKIVATSHAATILLYKELLTQKKL